MEKSPGAQLDSEESSSPNASNTSAITRPRRRRGLYIFLAIVLLLGAGEVTLRIIAGRDSVYNIRMGAEKEWDPHRRVKLRKNYVSGDLRTNSRGFLGPEFTEKKEPGSYRIVTLGDSASVIPPKRNYPRALEARLRELLPGEQIDVINASCSGYDSGQARTWYEREVDAIEHDMLIIYLGWNDMGQYNPDGLVYKLEETGYLKEPSLFDKAILNCYLLRSIYVIQGHWERRGSVSFEPLDETESKKYGEFYPQHFEENVRAIIELAKSRGRLVRLVNYGGLVNDNITEDEQQRIHFPRGMGKRMAKYLALKGAYEKAIEKVSNESGTPVIDVESFFQDPNHRKVFTDAAHFTESGSDMFAELVAEAIRKDIRLPVGSH